MKRSRQCRIGNVPDTNKHSRFQGFRDKQPTYTMYVAQSKIEKEEKEAPFRSCTHGIDFLQAFYSRIGVRFVM